MAKKPPGKCIFCGRGPLSNLPVRMSKEHIWADWLKDFIPRPYARTSHTVGQHYIDPITNKVSSQYKPGIHNQSGDPKTRRIRAVCEHCNNGWMSQIQDKVKPTLSRLIKGDWKELSDIEQGILATWACLFTIIYEQIDKPTIAVTDEERVYLMNKNKPPACWSIWIGRYTGTDQIATHHTGMCITSSSPDSDASPKCNTQITTFVAGEALFHCISATSEVDLCLDIYDTELDMPRIWPIQWRVIPAPHRHLDKTAADGVHSGIREALLSIYGISVPQLPRAGLLK